jgi:pyridoxine/pyridoxamine 5'-phosphate oxidase
LNEWFHSETNQDELLLAHEIDLSLLDQIDKIVLIDHFNSRGFVFFSKQYPSKFLSHLWGLPLGLISYYIKL